MPASVIITARNAAPWIGATLQSVIKQSVRDVEVIVIDGGSTDGTSDHVRAFGSQVCLIDAPGTSKAQARNIGIARARREFIAFVDADDLWLPSKLEIQLQAVQRGGHQWAYSDCTVFDGATGIDLGTWGQSRSLPSGDILVPLFMSYFIASPTPLIHRSVFDDVGCFDEELKRHEPEDWDMWLRIAARFPVVCVRQSLAKYRMHNRSLTAQEDPIRTFEGRATVAEQAAKREPERLGGLLPLVLAHHAVVAARQLARADRCTEARELFLYAARHQPSWVSYLSAAVTAVGPVPFRAVHGLREWMRQK